MLWLGVLTYVTLLVMATLFYKERVVMCDAAFQFFSILKNDGFAIQINRFGAALTQIFPLLASKMHLPLYAVALSYSLSFVLYYFSIFLIVLLGFKNEKIALVILLFNTLLVRHSFFWIQCEFVQGAVFTLLYLAILEHNLNKEKIATWFWVVSPFFIITIIYFYPSLLFILVFGILFYALLHPSKIILLGILMTSYLFLLAIKLKFFNNFYDHASMEGLKYLKSEFPNYLSLKSFKDFYRFLINDYYFVAIIWIINLVYLIFWKKYLHAILMSFFLLGVCFIINVNYATGVDQFYIESQYLILVVFVAFPFAYFLAPNLKLKPWLRAFMMVSIFISLLRIVVTSEVYKDRLACARKIAEESPTKRIMVLSDAQRHILKYTWGISFEVWLLSTLEHPKTRSVVYEDSIGQFDMFLQDSKKFITLMGIFEYQDLNSQYFKKDSVEVYTHY